MNLDIANDDFEQTRRVERATLVVDLDGFEGPLDLLLALAREQKVDLKRLSILALADQYLAFIARMEPNQLELAADYLVMAAWLAYLKSRLLLPEPKQGEDPTAEEMAAGLAFRLQRLEAMREAGEGLMRQPRLGRDVFARGAPEKIVTETRYVWQAELYDLVKAYADHKRRRETRTMHIQPLEFYSVDEALSRIEAILGRLSAWSDLTSLLPAGLTGMMARSALSSHLVATLELTRQGRLDIYQDGAAFGPLWVRRGGRQPIVSEGDGEEA
jgi:segregation and condensation protein A